MAISLKHAFSSAKSDGGDATLVQPSNWNAEHTLTLAAGKVLGRDTSGAGAAQELPIQVDTSGQVAIGTPAPDAPLTVSSNTTATTAPGTGTLAHLVGADAGNVRLVFDTFGGSSVILARRASGTSASPTALTADAAILFINATGRGSTAYGGARAQMVFYASEAWSDSAQGTYIVLGTTPNGSTTQAERVRIDNAGNVGIGGTSNGPRLFVSGAGANSQIVATDGTVTQFVGYANSSIAYTGTSSNHPLSVLTNNTERLKIDTNGFATVTGSLGRGAPVTKTGDFTLAATENWIICNKSSSLTVTFPAASSWTGREVTIKTVTAQTVVSASSNVVPIGSTTAGTAILAATAGKWATLVSDGTNWVIMATG